MNVSLQNSGAGASPSERSMMRLAENPDCAAAAMGSHCDAAMTTTSFDQLIPTLELAIGPVILISGVGLLLLTLTNRFGRLLDRARQLNRDHPESPAVAAAVRAQIAILHRRSAILRLSITLGAITVLLVPVLILVLFLSALLRLEAGWLIVTLFCLGQLTLIGSMLAFIRDMNLALQAFRLEIAER